MEEFVQLVVVGVMKGSLYGLLAMGMVLIYKTTGVVNVAQGQMAAVGAFVCYILLTELGLPLWFSLIGTFVLCGFMGWLLERAFMRPLMGQPIMALLMMTIVLMYFLRSLIGLAYAGEAHSYEPNIFPTEMLFFGDVFVGIHYILSVTTVVLLLVAFALFFNYSKLGLNMRATAEDQQVAQSVGLNVKRVFSMSWVIAAMVAGIGGIILANISDVSYQLGEIGLKALPVLLLGGLQSVPGAILGGLIIGITEVASAHFLDPLVGGGFAEVCPYIVMMIILIFRPYGLFGEARIERI